MPIETKTVSCSSCYGSGSTSCTCLGGKISCTSCSGGRKWVNTGWGEGYYESCSSCSGSGYINCFTCGGAGKVSCSRCGGRGQTTQQHWVEEPKQVWFKENEIREQDNIAQQPWKWSHNVGSGGHTPPGASIFTIIIAALVVAIGLVYISSSNGVATQYATVNTIGLNLRTCPSPQCDIVATMPQGLRVKIVGKGQSGWPEIEASGPDGAVFHGFANGKFLDQD